eukprot:2578644-Prymnesium_polylepis.1
MARRRSRCGSEETAARTEPRRPGTLATDVVCAPPAARRESMCYTGFGWLRRHGAMRHAGLLNCTFARPLLSRTR